MRWFNIENRTGDEAREWIRSVVNEIGAGFNPDTDPREYRDANGERLLSEFQAEALEWSITVAFKRLGDEVYDVCFEAVQAMFPEIGADYR